MRFTVCSSCGVHHYRSEFGCPHCGAARGSRQSGVGRRSAVAALLGLGLAGCGDKPMDTAEPTGVSEPEPTNEMDYGVGETGTPEPSMEDAYGVPAFDEDGDGFYDYDDCDDFDASTFPGSAENDSETECMTDADGDGYGSSTAASPVAAGTDCDDSNASIHPGADETEGDGDDSNCDGEEGS